MKKFFAMAAIALFTIASCSDDDSASNNNNGNTNTVLLKKTIATDSDGTVTSIYSYDGNKLTGITRSNGTSDVIIYSGDLITEWKKYIGTTLDENSKYEYNAMGYLVKETFTYGSDQDILYYTHNGDGTISYSYSSSGLAMGKFYGDRSVVYGTDLSGNPSNHWYYSTYDNKNNPLMNITGIGKIFFSLGGDGLNFTNNMTSVKRYGDNDVYINTLYSNQYTYNSANYPTTSVYTNHDEAKTIQTQFFYE